MIFNIVIYAILSLLLKLVPDLENTFVTIFRPKKLCECSTLLQMEVDFYSTTGMVCVDVWSSVWAEVDCGVCKKVCLFLALIVYATVCVWMVKLCLSRDLFNKRV